MQGECAIATRNVLTGVETRFFNCLPQLGGAHQSGVTGNAGLPRSERNLHLLDTGQRLEGRSDILHATLATHPGYRNHDFFHQTFRLESPAPGLSPACQRLRSSELDTTETELIAIAAPAITGLSIPSAARGMPSTL